MSANLSNSFENARRVIVVSIVALGFWASFLSLLIFFTLNQFRVESNEEFKKESSSFQTLILFSGKNESTSGFANLNHGVSEFDFIEFNDKNVAMLYEFGTDAYTCTGSCTCDDVENRRGLIAKSVGVIVAAISLILAFDRAREYFKRLCKEKLLGVCDPESVQSNIDGCEPYFEEGEVEEIEYEYLCKSSCVLGSFYLEILVLSKILRSIPADKFEDLMNSQKTSVSLDSVIRHTKKWSNEIEESIEDISSTCGELSIETTVLATSKRQAVKHFTEDKLNPFCKLSSDRNLWPSRILHYNHLVSALLSHNLLRSALISQNDLNFFFFFDEKELESGQRYFCEGRWSNYEEVQSRQLLELGRSGGDVLEEYVLMALEGNNEKNTYFFPSLSSFFFEKESVDNYSPVMCVRR